MRCTRFTGRICGRSQGDIITDAGNPKKYKYFSYLADISGGCPNGQQGRERRRYVHQVMELNKILIRRIM
jgi:hypothetical protein